MQIIKYEINKNILTVVFKENDINTNVFVVYTDIAYDSNLTKEQLLQNAYIQCKSAIDYEKTQTDHTITTDIVGDDFVPDSPKVSNVVIDKNNIVSCFNCLESGNLTQQYVAKVYDQYGDIINNTVDFILDTIPENVTLVNGLFTVGQIDNDYNLTLTATYNGVLDTLPIYIRKYVAPIIDRTPTLENRLSSVESAIAILMGA